ncbi:MAG: sigma-70 family RNA polymerase sigma factor [Prevotella sp.]|jgi:RNA polymerase sigma-70 factor (ECF subfamily)|nr:sigma-70 family RNA polymerase sigma factor [Prevotella sp.]MDR2001446.1 sigma-70 family RNA polymerase sigma factor [Prevotella sp.]
MMEDHNMDTKLLYALKQGNKSAFETVFRKYNAKIYHFVENTLYNKTLAEDVTQNVFLAVWEHRQEIVPERNFSAYLYVIAKNMIFRETEKMVLSYRYENEIHINQNEKDYSTEEAIDADILEETILRLANRLPQARKKIFCLRFIEDLSNKEIAVRLSISEKNVGMQIRRSLDYIRKHLKEYILLTILLTQST